MPNNEDFDVAKRKNLSSKRRTTTYWRRGRIEKHGRFRSSTRWTATSRYFDRRRVKLKYLFWYMRYDILSL